MTYDWDFSYIWHNLPAYGRGIGVSITLAIISCSLGILLGLVVAALLRANRLLRAVVGIFLDALRAVPELVIIFFFYFFPYNQLLGLPPPSPFGAVAIALVLVMAVFSSRLLDSAIDQVQRRHIEGARALGLSTLQVIRHVFFPSLVRSCLPPLVAFCIGILKATSLASIVGVADVVYVAKLDIAYNARSLEAWLFIAAVYVVLIMPLSYLSQWLEHSAWMHHQ